MKMQEIIEDAGNHRKFRKPLKMQEIKEHQGQLMNMQEIKENT